MEILKNSVKAVNDSDNKDKIININSYKDNNIYVLKVSDNGIGIKDDNLDKIWNFNYTTTNNIAEYNRDFGLNSPISGFGYGLPISKILIENFSGKIKVFSEFNRGTDVYMILDLKNNWLL